MAPCLLATGKDSSPASLLHDHVGGDGKQRCGQLIENGHLFLAVPPLFKITQGAKSF